jgi:hypothetical protein
MDLRIQHKADEMQAENYQEFCFESFFISLSYFSAPTHSLAAEHH